MAVNRIALRPPARADRQVWGALWRDYLDFYETRLPEETYDIAFDRLLSDDPATFQGLLAWDGSEALGLVHWLHHPHMWRPEGVIYLQDLFTAPEARGRGIARTLIEAVYAAADAAGAPRVYWLTQAENATARRLYDRIGRMSSFIKYDRP
ncbi:GNAT family N-acetyltransferase [Jannaschia seohaensis]|uniref:Ribosomal protein S18 acetylase RimI n=1 Tax=Jannaschia seohaensis TaxID=475081 RepID=A0A2Y9B271_9RHOB|nr:GNAT family N-acetyltransferase [Jannaschia seohaensis]PWJ13298.1 ribosomal protein S18 acetylase RimI-like enzyme [Jannaschia seohaensis]SSA50624.1 Ribosomal protein S18 acetylase RimI [Jannaschia seohaensis]